MKPIGRAFLIAFLFILVGTSISSGVFFLFETSVKFTPANYNIVIILSRLVEIGIVFAIGIKLWSIQWFRKGFSTRNVDREVLLAPIFGLCFVWFSIPLLNIAYGAPFDFSIEFRAVQLLDFSILPLILITPVTEEFIFRKMIQDNLKKTFEPFLSILISATAFAFIHLNIMGVAYSWYTSRVTSPLLDIQGLDWYHAYITFFGGLITAGLYHWHKHIWSPILFHFFWNLAIYAA